MQRTRRFEGGRFNYSIDYRQYQMEVIDEVTGKKTKELVHREIVKYFQFPFHFGTFTKFGPCRDTGEYYRNA